jgi:hypothetical protein
MKNLGALETQNGALGALNRCIVAQKEALEGLQNSGRRFATFDKEQDSDPDPH